MTKRSISFKTGTHQYYGEDVKTYCVPLTRRKRRTQRRLPEDLDLVPFFVGDLLFLLMGVLEEIEVSPLAIRSFT